MALTMAEFINIVDALAKADEFINQVVGVLAGVGLELKDVMALDGLLAETTTKASPNETSVENISLVSRAMKKVLMEAYDKVSDICRSS